MGSNGLNWLRMPAMVSISTGFSCKTDWKWFQIVLTGLECLQWF
jgi:hypothetical protein